MALNVWTDGSCNNNTKHGNSGIGGWGFCILDKNNELVFEDLGYFKPATSSTMEMMAVIKSLEYIIENLLESKTEVFIHSDSAYVVNCFLEKWYIRWQETDYYGIKNEELWKQMLKLYGTKFLKVRFVKVKGHAGIEWNERADLLAGEARKYLIENGD